eukprot:GEMP01034737.1.p1 GENE.GEMP01034737.1~~GEMP01034737.1.p1  ORF type:complete len:249 (+),score=34.93 GEMP01034737.1:447-1193(+)
MFMENYFESQREHIFRNVEVLIYVLGSAGDKRDTEQQKDFSYFKSAIESIRQLSPRARIFVLVHKLDLVHEKDREHVFNDYQEQIKHVSGSMNVQCFGTSIWDETLFKAWSAIVYSLMPNIEELEKQLEHFCEVCGADEVVLFERATFLVISSKTRKPMKDTHRFEKISNIVKQFKLSCGKSHASFKSLTVRNRCFTAFIEKFTSNTFVMIIVSDPSIHAAATLLNVEAAKAHFEDLAANSAAFAAHL